MTETVKIVTCLGFMLLPSSIVSGASLSANTWPCGIVPYKFASNPNSNLDGNQNPALGVYFQNAAEVWASVAGVQFVRLDNQSSVSSNYLQVSFIPQLTDRSGYSTSEVPHASIGFPNGGVHNAVLFVDDLLGTYKFINVHELGHVLGLVHEHQRSDRDTYITIDSSASNNSNYTEWGSVYSTPYDFGSIMHYPIGVPLIAGTQNPTIMLSTTGKALLTREGVVADQVGTYARLSTTGMDASGMAAIYPPQGTCEVSPSPAGATLNLSDIGATIAISATVQGQDRNPGTPITDFIWSSADTTVASVDNNGVVNAVGIGSTTITVGLAEMATITSSVTITVTSEPPPDRSGNWSWDPAANGGRGAWVWTGPMPPPPDNSGNWRWDPYRGAWVWIGPGSPPLGGGNPPPTGCWHWDPTTRSWIYDLCGGGTQPPPGSPIQIITSGDPNDKVGNAGVGSAQYLGSEQPLNYSIYFDNIPTATAAAQKVVVTDLLNSSLVDLTRVALGRITFVGNVITPPTTPLSAVGTYNTNVDLRPSQNLIVNIVAALNQTTGMLTWTYTSLDPSTMQPTTDPLAGFLPPGTEGSVSFSVTPKAAATGTQITNQATVVFDVNPSINTPVWLNTIDSTKPTSHVNALPTTQTATTFSVSWAGSDVGAGVQDYTIYSSVNGGTFTPWQTNTTATSGTFAGAVGQTYGFYSIARDLVGNVETSKATAEATTTISSAVPPTIQCTGCYFLINGLRATLAFNVSVIGSTSTFTYNYRTSTQTVQFISTTTSAIAMNGNTATFSGQGNLNGQSGYGFSVTAKDGGAAGSGLDTVSVSITGPNNYSFSAQGSIGGGDIIVHQ
ncbi:MAG TPA: M12 family metallopeptidase [Bryobacteraceae bacterium]|nr:M12 family metallopeptidase [Bryobacteraceae bacterium]